MTTKLAENLVQNIVKILKTSENVVKTSDKTEQNDKIENDSLENSCWEDIYTQYAYCIIHQGYMSRCNTHYYTIENGERKYKCIECCKQATEDEEERHLYAKHKAEKRNHDEISESEKDLCLENKYTNNVYCYNVAHSGYVSACGVHYTIKDNGHKKYECYECCKQNREKRHYN